MTSRCVTANWVGDWVEDWGGLLRVGGEQKSRWFTQLYELRRGKGQRGEESERPLPLHQPTQLLHLLVI